MVACKYKVKDLNKCIQYCEENGYMQIKASHQTRTLYTNSNKILARITTDVSKSKEEIILDFKDENDSPNILKSSKESKPLAITRKNMEAVESILDMLGYNLNKVLKRDRIVYQRDEIKIEIDSYLKPQVCYIITIKGKKNEVDKIYSELKDSRLIN